MRAGRLRHRVTIQRQGEGKDELGQPVEGWEDVATVWAEVTGLSGREYIASGGEQSEVSMQVLMRYRTGIDETMQVIHPPPTGGGEIYEIISALPDARRRQLILMCKSARRS
ncbi:phage head closure protein [Salinicola corii]|uniref:Phage head closure protein n=1 Tax=Salinicola corii TaxID=2606937 RepID=A0A640WDJ0_9GAMM|nr:phage head closure protein [Salinicola corii]KAA0017110.1 phage head closure protein [Salinicola corii]